MKFFKLSLITFIAGLSLLGCNSAKTTTDTVSRIDTSTMDPYPQDSARSGANSQWAKESLDLRAVGALLEKSGDAVEFERLLNSGDGVNNLDLNGDGYVDYVSVSEYEDRDDDQRGLSLFSMFGPNEIQEIAQIIFNRQGQNFDGARVLLTGNEQIYGDNRYYETDWAERGRPIVGWLFKNRDAGYRSAYYNENYPDTYQTYQVVETPVYRRRIEQYSSAPVFVETSNPSITQIKIKSPYNGKSLDKIYSKLAKPTKEQIEFSKNNPNPPAFDKIKKDRRQDDSTKPEKQSKENPERFEKIEKSNDDKPFKQEKSDKFERKNDDRPNSPKAEKQDDKERKQENKAKRNGGGDDNPNKGDGKNKGNGGGKGNGKKN